MSTSRVRPLAERLRDAGRRAGDVATLARTVFDVVADDVDHTFACLATTDPATGLITGAHKSEPLPVRDEEFSASEYGTVDINQFADLARRPIPVGVLSIDTEGEPMRCARMREFMLPRFGFTDELRLACRSRGTVWAALALYRGRDDPPFTAPDGRVLAEVHDVIADGVRRTLFLDPAVNPPVRIPVVLIVDGDDHVTDLSPAAGEVIDDLGGLEHGALPAGLIAVSASARAAGAPVVTQVPTRSGRWLTVRALTLDGGTGRSVVLSVETASPAALGQLRIAAHGLTAREQDVVRLLLQGASTQVISSSLHLSPHTVQDHLKAIFGKLGVSSRRELVAQLALA